MTHRVRFYPHNDLLNLAHYHREIINNKANEGNDDAVSLDCMSFIMALAFGVEAFLNFIGSQKVNPWHERQSFRKKVDQIYGTIGGSFDDKSEPYSTIIVLKNLRDSMAHGQPYEGDVKIRSMDELWAELCAPWDHCLNVEFVNNAYGQIKAWQEELLNLAGIPIEETITRAL